MESAITGLILITLLLISVLTLAHALLSVQDQAIASYREMTDRLLDVARTDIASADLATVSGNALVEVTVRNEGQTKLADYEDWDVIVQYDTGASDHIIEWLPYESVGSLRQWKVKGLYLDADAAIEERFDPHILNPGEELVVQLWLSPTIGISTTNLVTIGTPQGITASTVFTN